MAAHNIPRSSLMTIDSQLEAKDEEYAPLSEMPIKKLEFTPFKPMPRVYLGSASKHAPQQQAAAAPTDAPAPAPAAVQDPIQVFLRLRPLPTEGVDSSMTVVDEKTVAMHAPAMAASLYKDDNPVPTVEIHEQDKYHFSHVFGPETNQDELYSRTAEPLVDAAFEGRDGLVFAYGPTNSGKTFTIMGGKEENAGILPRVIRKVFDNIERRREECGEEWTVWVNFMEIYNENIYDLLDETHGKGGGETRPRCELKDQNGHIVVKGLKQMQVRDAGEAILVSRFGAKFRQTAETCVNDVSSRSHSVFNIKLFRGQGADVKDENQVFGKLAIVDLAGSERARKTKATGDRLKEASNINVSLMNLGRCLEAIKWNQDNPTKVPHVVPFRHSNLTRIFQDHFQNASRMVMIIAANPHKDDYDEALQALRYGCIAKEIVVRKTMNTRKPMAAPDHGKGKDAGGGNSTALALREAAEEQERDEWEEVQVDDLVDELECARAQVYELQAKNAQLEDLVREEVCAEMMVQMEEMERAFQIRIEDERIATEQKFERKIDIITREASRREYELSQDEIQDLQAQLKYYKQRTDELQREHKVALQKLMPSGAGHAEISRANSDVSQESEQEMKHRAEMLEAQVSSLQREVSEKVDQLEQKRRQKEESRQVLEEADNIIRHLEGRCKCAEQQNDRLREELAQGHAQLQRTRDQAAMSDRDAIEAKAAFAQLRAEVKDNGDRASESVTEANGIIARLRIQLQEASEARTAAERDAGYARAAADRLVWEAEGGRRAAAEANQANDLAERLVGRVAEVEREREELVRAHENEIFKLQERLAMAEAATAAPPPPPPADSQIDALERDVIEARSGRVESERQVERLHMRVQELEHEMRLNHDMVKQYDDILTKKQKQDLARKTVNHVPFVPKKAFNTSPSYQSAANAKKAIQTEGIWTGKEGKGEAPAATPTAASASKSKGGGGGFPSLRSIFSRSESSGSVSTPRTEPEASQGKAAEWAAEHEGDAEGARLTRGRSAVKPDDRENDVENCPLHLLEYMLPDQAEGPFSRTSPFKSRAPQPMSPSVANIKAALNSAAAHDPASSAVKGGKTRKLFNGTAAEEAEALNDAAGSTLVESTPMARRLRSARPEVA